MRWHSPWPVAPLPWPLLQKSGGIKDVTEWDGIESLSMACPALPLCGLAISEAERALPDINTRIRGVLDGLGFDKSEKFVVRMTGERKRV